MPSLNAIVTWILVAIMCSMLIKILLMLDSNKKAHGHIPGPCRHVEGINRGSEDIELLHQDGIALITSGLRLMNNSETEKFRGRVYVYEWNEPQNVPLSTGGVKRGARDQTLKAHKVTIVQGEDKSFDVNAFNPQGLSSYVSKGRINVYIVNHAPNGDTVECFVYDKAKRTLFHSKTIRNEHIYAASDLAAVGPDKFYIVNTNYFRSWWMRWLEIYMLLNLGNVVYYDGKAAVLDKWMPMPIGIAIDKEHKHLYVTNAMQEFVRLYNVSGDKSLIKHVDMHLMTTPHHVFVDPTTSELWVGAHPVMHEMIHHLSHPKTSFSSSQVIHIKLQGGMDRWVLAETFADDGHLLNASSVVVRHQNQLLIGSISNKLLLCDLMHEDFQT